WFRAEKDDPAIAAKHFYLNAPFFLLRVVIYFACWSLLSYLLNKASREEDQGGSLSLWRRMESISGGGLVLFGLTVTFASIDWVMSLEPRWSSTIYGLLFLI